MVQVYIEEKNDSAEDGGGGGQTGGDVDNSVSIHFNMDTEEVSLPPTAAGSTVDLNGSVTVDCPQTAVVEVDLYPVFDEENWSGSATPLSLVFYGPGTKNVT